MWSIGGMKTGNTVKSLENPDLAHSTLSVGAHTYQTNCATDRCATSCCATV